MDIDQRGTVIEQSSLQQEQEELQLNNHELPLLYCHPWSCWHCHGRTLSTWIPPDWKFLLQENHEGSKGEYLLIHMSDKN